MALVILCSFCQATILLKSGVLDLWLLFLEICYTNESSRMENSIKICGASQQSACTASGASHSLEVLNTESSVTSQLLKRKFHT